MAAWKQHLRIIKPIKIFKIFGNSISIVTILLQTFSSTIGFVTKWNTLKFMIKKYYISQLQIKYRTVAFPIYWIKKQVFLCVLKFDKVKRFNLNHLVRSPDSSKANDLWLWGRGFLMHIWILSLKAKIVESKPVASAVIPYILDCWLIKFGWNESLPVNQDQIPHQKVNAKVAWT